MKRCCWPPIPWATRPRSGRPNRWPLRFGVAERVQPEAGVPTGVTPFMRWLIANGQNERTLVPLIRHTAQMYRQRALRQADWLRIYLPTVLTVGIGGTATLIYGLTLFLPYTTLLKDLAGRL